MHYRSGEEAAEHQRAGRYFCITGQWYFSSREQVKVGPFQNFDEAELGLLPYLRYLKETTADSDQRGSSRQD